MGCECDDTTACPIRDGYSYDRALSDSRLDFGYHRELARVDPASLTIRT